MAQTKPSQQPECSICMEEEFLWNQILKCPHCDLYFCKKCFRDQLLKLKTPEIGICICGNTYSLYQVLDLVGSTWFHQTFSKQYKKVLLAQEEHQDKLYQSSRLFKLYQQVSELRLKYQEGKALTRRANVNFDSLQNEFKLKTADLDQRKVSIQRRIKQATTAEEVKAARLELKVVKKELGQVRAKHRIDIAPYKDKLRLARSNTTELPFQLNQLATDISFLESNPQPLEAEEPDLEALRNAYNCPRPGCNGLVTTKSGTCDKCSALTCLDCHEPVDPTKEEHECDPGILKNLKALLVDQATKPCPRCRVPIHKYVGCNDVFCTKCHLKFNFRTGKEIQGAFHNPEYNRFLAERQNEDDDCNPSLAIYINRFMDLGPSWFILTVIDALVPELTEIRDQLLEEIELPYPKIKAYYRYLNNEITRQGYANKLLDWARANQRNSQVIDYLNTAITIGRYYKLKLLDYLRPEIVSNFDQVTEAKLADYLSKICQEIAQLNTYLYPLGRVGGKSYIITLLPPGLAYNHGSWILQKVPYAQKDYVRQLKTKVPIPAKPSLAIKCAFFNNWNKQNNFRGSHMCGSYRLVHSYINMEMFTSNILEATKHVLDVGIANLVKDQPILDSRSLDLSGKAYLSVKDQSRQIDDHEKRLSKLKISPLMLYYVENQQI